MANCEDYMFLCDDCDINLNDFNEYLKHREVHTKYVSSYAPNCFCKKSTGLLDYQLHICNDGEYITPNNEQQQDFSEENLLPIVDLLSNYQVELYSYDKSITFRWREIKKEYKTEPSWHKTFALPIEYKCDICFKVLATRKNLLRHRSIHTGDQPYECHFCEYKFFDIKTLRDHIKAHKDRNEKPYQCDLCFKKFSSKQNLRNHLYLHTGQKTFHCNYCDKTFAQKSNLRTHLRKHSSEPKVLLKCELCPRMYSYRGDLKRHMYVHTGEEPYSCKICNEKFCQRSMLRKHHRKHNIRSLKRHQCELCPKQFAAKQNLIYHMNLHNGEKPYKCQFCEKLFAHRSNLLRHIKIHVQYEEKPHKCEVCPKKYFNKQDLKAHMCLHTGEKPFACKLCDEKYSKRCFLIKHMLFHAQDDILVTRNAMKETNRLENFNHNTKDINKILQVITK